MDLKLTDKIAVVTGASKGIGLAVVRTLAEEGAPWSPAPAPPTSLDGLDGVTARRGRPRGGGRAGDARRGARWTLTAASTSWSTTSARVRLRLGGFLGTSDDEFEWALRLNYLSAMRTTRAALPAMVERGGGAIVNVASVNAFFEPDAGVLDYGAAKAALVNLTKSLAQEFGPQGVRVNCGLPRARGDRSVAGRGAASPRPSRARPASAPTRRARRWSRASAASRPGASRPRRRSPPLVAMLASERTGNVTGVQLRHRRRADQDDVGPGRDPPIIVD